MDKQNIIKKKPFFNPRDFRNSYLFIFLIIWAAIVLFPILWAFLASVKPDSELFTLHVRWLPKNPTLENYRKVLTNPIMIRYLLNTIYVSLVSSVFVIIFATMGGYGFSRYRLKGGRVGLTIVIASQMFPPIMFIVPYFLLLKTMHFYNTYIALIITRVTFYIPFSTLMMKSFFDSLPKELEEAAIVDGCSQFGIFLRIILPLSLTGVATIFIFSFLNSWNEFLFSISLVSEDALRTITVGIANQQGQYGVDWGQLMSLSLVSLIFPLLIFMFMQQYFIKGLTAGAVKT